MFDITDTSPVLAGTADKPGEYRFGVDKDTLRAELATFSALIQSGKVVVQSVDQVIKTNIQDFQLRTFTITYAEKADVPLDPAATVDLYMTHDDALGVIRLARWPEGYVLWVGGEIRYKSWETK